MNIWDILILAGIGAAVVAAFRILRAKGQRGGCGCGCAGCTKTCDARQDRQTGTED